MNEQIFYKKCKLCNGKFITHSKIQIFCSVHCRNKYHSIITARQREYEKKPKIKKCEFCGKEFERVSNGQKYCSNECKKNSHNAKNKKHNEVEYKKIKSNKKYKRKMPSKSINEIARLCRESGLSYGQYVAQNNL